MDLCDGWSCTPRLANSSIVHCLEQKLGEEEVKEAQPVTEQKIEETELRSTLEERDEALAHAVP